MVRSHLEQLLRGVVQPLILFIIGELPMHGYRLAKELEKRSSGYFRLTGSTVYSALRRLEMEGLVLSSWQQAANNQRRRCYELTEKGRQVLAANLAELRRFSSAASEVLNHQ